MRPSAKQVGIAKALAKYGQDWIAKPDLDTKMRGDNDEFYTLVGAGNPETLNRSLYDSLKLKIVGNSQWGADSLHRLKDLVRQGYAELEVRNVERDIHLYLGECCDHPFPKVEYDAKTNSFIETAPGCDHKEKGRYTNYKQHKDITFVRVTQKGSAYANELQYTWDGSRPQWS